MFCIANDEELKFMAFDTKTSTKTGPRGNGAHDTTRVAKAKPTLPCADAKLKLALPCRAKSIGKHAELCTTWQKKRPEQGNNSQPHLKHPAALRLQVREAACIR